MRVGRRRIRNIMRLEPAFTGCHIGVNFKAEGIGNPRNESKSFCFAFLP